MNITVTPSKINGTVTAPPSKSATHRAVILASLATGKSVIDNPLFSDDTRRTIDGLVALGIPIEVFEKSIVVHGGPDQLHAPTTTVELENSGTSLRLLTGIAALINGETTFTGSKRLLERPMSDLADALLQIGVTVAIDKQKIAIKGRGVIPGEAIRINAAKSSQFLSSLLLISPLAEKDTSISISDLQSKPYVALTIEMMRQFGVHVEADELLTTITIPGKQQYKPRSIIIEGDYSSSSYLFAAAALVGGGVTVTNLNKNSTQGDRYFLTLIEQMGCVISFANTRASVTRVRPLRPLTIALGDYPDIVQTVAIVAAVADGETILTDIAHLQHKETDRLHDTATELSKFGISVTASRDELRIRGGIPNGATITTHNDHRMAMAFSILGLAAKGETVISNAEVVTKSYPDFFVDLKKIGARIKEST